MHMILKNALLTLATYFFLCTPTFAWKFQAPASEPLKAADSTVIPATGTLEVAFSPNEGSEALVIKAINSAHKEIRMLSYSFTSAPVTRALIQACKRRVSIKLVVDEE